MNQRTIKGIRADLGLTQHQMAEKLGINIHTLVRYEKGRTKLPFEIVIKIADLGGIADLRQIKV